MKDCKKLRKDIVAFLFGELGPEDQLRVKAHLKVCPLCRKEARELEIVQKESASLSSDISEAMSTVDWETLPEIIADEVFKPTSAPRSFRSNRRWFSLLFQPKWRPVYAGILLGMILGSFVTYYVLRPSGTGMVRTQDIVLTSDFLEKAELEVARRETLEYLEKSQYILLDFIQTPSGLSGQAWRDELTMQKARDLLSKKKFIDPQLNKFRMAKAKQICDQIEYLFYELTQISEYLPPEDLKRIQDLIRERQLMLKIKLVKKELMNSEV